MNRCRCVSMVQIQIHQRSNGKNIRHIVSTRKECTWMQPKVHSLAKSFYVAAFMHTTTVSCEHVQNATSCVDMQDQSCRCCSASMLLTLHVQHQEVILSLSWTQNMLSLTHSPDPPILFAWVQNQKFIKCYCPYSITPGENWFLGCWIQIQQQGLTSLVKLGFYCLVIVHVGFY